MTSRNRCILQLKPLRTRFAFSGLVMKFLVDIALSPLFAEGLREADHDVTPVRDYGLQEATDDVVLKRSDEEDRI